MQALPDLVVDSVTGVEVTLPVAGPGVRALAFLTDWVIRTVVAVGWFVVSALVYNGRWSLAQPLVPDAPWFVFVVTPCAAIFLLYHPLLEVAMRGRTPGKRFAGVRLVARSGGSPGIAALLIRNVFRVIDSFPLLYGVGLTAAIATREHIRIGDVAAGTVLVYERSDAALPEPVTVREQSWQATAERARRLSRNHAADSEDAALLLDGYRLLARDLSTARSLQRDTPAREYLESAYAEAHATLHKPAWHFGHALRTLFRDDLPRVVANLRFYIIWSTAIFMLTVAAGYLLIRAHPGLIALFASPELIASVEKGQLWTEGLLNVVPSSVLSLQILANNIVVSLVAYCAGVLFGLGTIYILGLNGMMLGAVFAFTHLHGLDGSLFGFIVAHGLVEISVMCLSGAAGAAVGEALIRPAQGTRSESFRAAAKQSGKLLAACALLLFGSGLIEGYVSPDPDVPLWGRIAIGVAYWIFMVALLRGWLFKPFASGATLRIPR